MLGDVLDAVGLGELRYMKPRQTLAQLLNFCLVLSSAFMMWKALSLAADSPSPIVVVLSGSMEPAFQRGDILFLWNRNLEMNVAGGVPVAEGGFGGTQVGEIIVYNVAGKDIPIVHRVVRRHKGEKTNTELLTKGDNNPTDDVELYARGRYYINREKEVIGSVVGYLPFVGYITILLSEHPWLKSVMLGVFGLLALVQRE